MNRTNMFIYPWDLVDPGVDRTLDHLRRIGITGISLASSYHTLQAVLAHNPKRRTVTIPDAAVYFEPDPSYFRGTPIQPNVSPMVGEYGDFWQAAREACRKAEMGLDAWNVCLHNSRLARQFPEYAAVNMMGEPYSNALCPSHPEVRLYVRGLVQNLDEVYNPRWILLESPGWTSFPHHQHFKVGVPFDENARWVLSLCFCGACLSQATLRGIDARALRTRIRTVIDRILAGDRRDWLSQVPDLREYQEMRYGIVAGLVKEATSGVFSRVEVLLALAPQATGIDGRILAQGCDGLASAVFSHETDVISEGTRHLLETAGAAERSHLVLSLMRSEIQQMSTLVAHLEAARAAGVANVGFYNYGLTGTEQLVWLGEALRRSSDIAGDSGH